MTDKSKLLADLARVKALFQQRTLEAILTDGAPKSKPDQELAVKEETRHD